MTVAEATEAGAPSRTEVVERARALFPLIRESAIEAERARHLPETTVQAYKEAGLVRTLMPKRFGGYELDWTTAYEVGREIGRADGSHGWCMSYWADHSWLVGYFPEKAQQEVWADGPDALIATSFVPQGKAEPADGGYRLTGTWPWGSGITHSGWTVLGGLVFEGDHPDLHLFLVPRSEFEILDVWHNAGLSATGSDTVRLENVFIPKHRTLSMALMRDGGAPGSEVNSGRNWQVPILSVAYYSLLGPATGAARGALDAWIDWSKSKVQSYTGHDLSALTTQQITLASIEMKIDAAETVVRQAISRIEEGELPIQIETRVRNRRDFVWSMRTLVAAMDDLIQVSGASGLFEASPIQRAWRDVHAISTHVTMNWAAAAENYGRQRLGLPLNERDPFF